MLVTDSYYARLLSSRLSLFKYKGGNVWNFRCPVCGDSEADKHKARGYLFPYKDGLSYKCHNCGVSMRFSTLLRDYFQDLYKEYTLELYTNHNRTNEELPTKAFQTDNTKRLTTLSNKMTRITDLLDKAPARKYIESRRIPRTEQFHLYYTEDFNELVNEYVDKKVSSNPRIVIPFYDRNWNLMGFQGRVLPQYYNDIRYITIKLSETFPKIYGLHRLEDKPSIVYVVEGPFDSLFLDSAIAMMGSDLSYSDICSLSHTDNVVFVYDNEPRNRQIVNKMQSDISSGHRVVIWPEHFEYKDINDAIFGGLTKNQISDIIEDNTYQGLFAEAKIRMWSKI